jgi:aminomethyltransferase
VTDAALRRTSLYERHAELGAKLVPFAGWEMPVTYEGCARAHGGAHHAGMFDVSHMGEVEVEGPGALAFLQRVLSNDVAMIAVGGANTRASAPRTGGVLDDLFAYRLGGDRYLLVTNSASPRRRPRWLGRWSRGFDVACATSPTATRCSPCRARTPARRRVDAGDRPAAAMRVDARACRQPPGAVCGTGYTGEDGVELLIDPEIAPRSGWSCSTPASSPAARRPRHAAPRGLLPPARQRPQPRAEPGRGRARLVLRGGDRLPRRRSRGAGARRGTAERLAPFKIEGAGIPRQGNPVLPPARAGRHRHQRQLLPSLEIGIGMAYLRSELAEPGTKVEIDVRGKHRGARIASKPLYESPSSRKEK